MNFIRATSTTEVLEGKTKKVVVGGKDFLIANVKGEFYALSNICPHAGGSLADGTLNGSTITCKKHGAQFDLKTGEAVGDAKILFFKTKPKNAGCYKVQLNGTDVMIGVV
jgi:nitrite reductase/ring-hydroxylating ferredoxin subunit